ncbi:MAG TPA: hypothetical protein VFR37_12925 [Longimicrobium sp.]|nr:hypothetical protein [Longimicrobium sp.]
MLEVRSQERKGCLWTSAAVLSLGLGPLIWRRLEAQLPHQLTDDEMVLRNGTRIPWSQFTSARGTRILMNDTYIGTRWILTHAGGKVQIQTNTIHDADQVMQFILGHLPAAALPPAS